MKGTFRMFRRADRSGVFYWEHRQSGGQRSLRTKCAAIGKQVVATKKLATVQPALNLELAKSYVAAHSRAAPPHMVREFLSPQPWRLARAQTITTRAAVWLCDSIYMLLTIALVLLVLYLLALLAFKITAGLIHLILVIAVILFILHFVRGRA